MSCEQTKWCCRWRVALPLLLALVFAAPAAAFQFEVGEFEGSLDTTLSYGMSWRMQNEDKDLIGTANGGRAYSVNGDDGNLNYDKDELVSQVAKITSELELRWRDFGLFVRGSAFQDQENYKRSRERTELRAKPSIWSAATPTCSTTTSGGISISARCSARSGLVSRS